MERSETIKILAVLKAAYPHSYKDLTKRDAESMIDLWTKMFADESYETVSAAVSALISIRKEGFSPTIGEVKERLQSFRDSQQLSEQDAWAMVSRSCSNGLYGYKKEFDKLPPEVQSAVGSPEQIRVWATMDSNTLESVVASNFMRNYKAKRTKEHENAKLPSSIQNLISGISEGMKLIK